MMIESKNGVRRIVVFDSILGGLICSFVSFDIAIGMGFLLIGYTSRQRQSLLIPAVVIVATIAALELWFLAKVWLGILRKQYPLALTVPLGIKQPPRLLRPPMAIFWLAHCLLGVGFVTGLHLGAEEVFFAWKIACYLAAAGFTYLTYCYAMMAIASLTRQHSVIGTVWKARIGFNLAVGVIGSLLPWFLKRLDQ